MSVGGGGSATAGCMSLGNVTGWRSTARRPGGCIVRKVWRYCGARTANARTAHGYNHRCWRCPSSVGASTSRITSWHKVAGSGCSTLSMTSPTSARLRCRTRRYQLHPVEPQERLGTGMGRSGRRTLALRAVLQPQLDPVDKAFFKLEAMLGKIGELTVNGLWGLIVRLVDILRPWARANCFTSCGYSKLIENRSKTSAS